MTKEKPFELVGTTKIWDHKEGDQYIVTGKDRSGRRFRLFYKNWIMADGINLWSGSKWLVRDGKRYLIKKVRN